MLLVILGHIAALNIEARLPRVRSMGGTPGENVDHVVFSMLLAVRRISAALEVERRYNRTLIT